MLERERVFSAAYGCLLEQAWHTLPVCPVRFQLPYAILSYQEYARLAGISVEQLVGNPDLFEGCSVTGLRNRALLLYNDHLPPRRQRFTIAHELGHLLLKHGTRNRREEDEANFFAATLLMPDALLLALLRRGVRLTDAFLIREFDVSRGAAHKKRLSLLSPSLPHCLDDRVETLFFPVISRLAPIVPTDIATLHDRYLNPKK